ncbi:hypothetical protein Tco_0792708 [Tanacetum coccineum]
MDVGEWGGGCDGMILGCGWMMDDGGISGVGVMCYGMDEWGCMMMMVWGVNDYDGMGWMGWEIMGVVGWDDDGWMG